MRADLLRCGVALPAGADATHRNAPRLIRELLRARLTWQLGAKGPAAYDCWSLTQLLQECLFGRVLTEVDLGAGASRTDILRAISGHHANAQWVERDGPPQHGDAVTMAHGDTPWHVGTFLEIDRGVVAHIAEAGFALDNRVELKAKGYTSLRFHRFAGGAQ